MSIFRVPIPSTVRQVVLSRAGGRCEDCGKKVRLELHHLRYETVIYDEIEDICGHETPEDLRALCRECHLSNHIDPAGIFWRDPEEMECHWSTYWAELCKK